MPESADVIVVGGGAAGLATAIFAARWRLGCSVLVLDGARKLGAKILVSGGGRCNVTNAVVTPEDFRGGSRNTIRRILNAFPVPETVAFFREIGVSLHEEEHGKLFPDTNSARTVLDALLREAHRASVQIRTEHRVLNIERIARGSPHAANAAFSVATAAGEFVTPRLVLATGGMSLPKTGSDGAGYELARQLGHSIVPTTPALAPLVLDGDFHKELSGVAHEAEIAVRPAGGKAVRLRGSMLWTHFGVSGPVILNASGYWHRMRLEGRPPSVSASLLDGASFEAAEQWLLEAAAVRPKASLQTVVAERLPARLAQAALRELKLPGHVQMTQLARDDRRRLIHALLEWPLPVRDSRGYAYAEVTAGGVPLAEIDPATMASRVCPGLHLVGEILDVDGRIGGFNFQWAWSSGFVAGRALGQRA